MDNQNQSIDKIMPIEIEKEMRTSFINYAMSVIVARALPDARDGLKPVHRRILHSMNELNLDPSKAYKKSARIVGDTMGKYHPHGDSSIYDSMVRMAQDFSMRYMLVDGHGNFGSMDGDSAAAPRYTEARLAPIAMEMLNDIDKNTVDFTENYDGEFKEPVVLPSRFPNLLVNGSAGIAVGMATNIPPHNLSEVIDGVLMMIDNFVNEQRETEISELLTAIKGPDFPTGATILGTSGIRQAYLTGRGKVLVRATAEIEPMANGRDMIVIKDIPYQVNRAKLVEKIAELVKDKRVEGISDLRNESDRFGTRVVVELKKDANANVILNNLYKYSSLQESFGIIMLALVDGEAKILNLKELLSVYLKHQKEVVTRRTEFDLAKALKRAHIVEGFLKALDYIDEIIAIIRANREISVSKGIIMEKFGFTQEQADAIVEMRLRALSGLERERLEKEAQELAAMIREWQAILADETLLYGVIRKELVAVRTKYGDERRTKIEPFEGEIDFEDLIDESMSVITMTHFDYVKRLPLDTYKSQNRGGRGIMGMTTRDEDFVRDLFISSTHDDVLFITNKGRAFRKRGYEIPEAGRTARGTAIVNLIQIDGDEKIAAVLPVRDYEAGGYLMMITRAGVVKKTKLEAFSNIKKSGLIALNIREDDELIKVLRTTGDDDIFIATRSGMGVRFAESDVREMGRTATGVRGITLREDDYVIGAEILSEDGKILFSSENGFGKCTERDEFRMQRRSGIGLKIYKTTEKTGSLVGLASVTDKDELMIINSEGIIIRIRVQDIATVGRVTQGVKLIQLPEGVKVVSIAKIPEDYVELDEESETEESEAEENISKSEDNE